jgi:hypothetical protein
VSEVPQLTLQEHINVLCAVNRIEVSYRRNGGRAWRKRRAISIPPVKTQVTYAVALHEIGHVLGKNAKRKLDREALAWQWAKANAQIWTPRMDAKMQACLKSYADWFLRKRRRGVNVGSSAMFDMLRNEVLTTAIP